MARKGLAATWLEANFPSKPNWKGKGKFKKPKEHVGWKIRLRRSELANGGRADPDVRDISVKEFVYKNRGHDGTDCLFVPGAQKGVPANLKYLDRGISAARLMLLLTRGTPKFADAECRHKCGNGHLSCVNPRHLEWGSRGDNVGDANIHRAMPDATVEDKCRAVDARTSLGRNR